MGFSGLSSAQASTFVAHYNGAIWQSVPSPNVGASSAFNGVVALASNNVWAVGSSSLLDDVLFAGVVTAPGRVWIVGSEDDAAPNKPIGGTLAITTAASAGSS